ncbi:MAG: HAD family hydrolase [Patescibacteria group bacterium]|jgi:FMN phosphatase YigB (HAD superfamily)
MKPEIPKYILTDDSRALFSKLNGGEDIIEDRVFNQAASKYFAIINQQIEQAFDGPLKIVGETERRIESRLQSRVRSILKSDQNVVCICLDRFLFADFDKDQTFADRFFRFSTCRTIDGRKEPRQGNPSFADQIQNLLRSIPDIRNRKVVVVDDGLFSGGTINDFLMLLKSNGIEINLEKIIGYMGPRSVMKASDRKTEILQPIDNLFEWVDVRDFSPLGGKKLNASANNMVTTSIPYLYPWSEGSAATLDMSPAFFDTSIAIMKGFRQLVVTYELLRNTKLRFRDLIKAGYPLPTDKEKTVPISINDTVTDYLDRCIGLVEQEKNRKVVICDMDGTFYQLDGKGGGYQNSKLELAVQTNALLFIQRREKCTPDQAQLIFSRAQQDPVGASLFLAEKYGISRTDYFNEVWNIDPAGIVVNYEVATGSLCQFKGKYPGVKLVLLTSAPRVWAEKVLKFLGIREQFELIYTGEQFGSKTEVFALLAGRYKPENMLSIGDQQATDIEPAQQLGMSTLVINSPDEVSRILQL